MFDVLGTHKLYAKRSNYQIFRTEIEYLGHVLFEECVSVDPKKFETVARWPMPKNKTEVKRLLGLTTYMKKYVRNFAKIATPVMDLLKNKFKRIT